MSRKILQEILELTKCKPVEAVGFIEELVSEALQFEDNILPLGTFVAHVEDDDNFEVGLVALYHEYLDEDDGTKSYSIRWLSDGHLSLRRSVDLKVLPPEVATKAWCRNSIEYKD